MQNGDPGIAFVALRAPLNAGLLPFTRIHGSHPFIARLQQDKGATGWAHTSPPCRRLVHRGFRYTADLNHNGRLDPLGVDKGVCDYRRRGALAAGFGLPLS